MQDAYHRFPRIFYAYNSRLFQGFVQVKLAILQVLVQTILAPKDRCQMHSKIAGAQNMKKMVSI